MNLAETVNPSSACVSCFPSVSAYFAITRRLRALAHPPRRAVTRQERPAVPSSRWLPIPPIRFVLPMWRSIRVGARGPAAHGFYLVSRPEDDIAQLLTRARRAHLSWLSDWRMVVVPPAHAAARTGHRTCSNSRPAARAVPRVLLSSVPTPRYHSARRAEDGTLSRALPDRTRSAHLRGAIWTTSSRATECSCRTRFVWTDQKR